MARGRAPHPSNDVADRLLEVVAEASRPMVRGDCEPGGFNAQRPCRFGGCRYYLPAGACALDAAGDGPHSLSQVARLMGLERHQVHYLERSGIRKAKREAAKLPPQWESFDDSE